MTDSPPRRGIFVPYKWTVVGMLWFVCFFSYADRQAIFSIFPKLRDEFGFDVVQLGLIGSAFTWVYALGGPLAGYLADRLPRRRIILTACLFWSVITGATGLCGQLWSFITVRALSGLGETLYYPAAVSLLSDYHDSRTRSKAFSFHQSGVYIGTIAGSWLGAWFAEHWGWRAGFYFFGGAGVILVLAFARFLREPMRGAVDVGQALPPLGAKACFHLLKSKPTALLLMAAFLCANFVATIFLTWTPTFLVDKFGFKLTAAGLSGSLFINLASACSVPLGGILADRLARRFAGGRILIQAGGLLAGAALVAVVGLTQHVSTLLIGMALFGLCKGVYDANIFASLYDVIEPRARGTAAGIMNTVGWGGGALGPLGVGFATKYGHHARQIDNMSEAIACGSVVYLIGAGLLLIAAIKFVRQDLVERVVPNALAR